MVAEPFWGFEEESKLSDLPKIPNDVILNMFYYLDIQSLGAVGRVSAESVLFKLLEIDLAHLHIVVAAPINISELIVIKCLSTKLSNASFATS